MAQEYKLKGLSSLDLKPGEKREVEVEGIEEGKVLLCNVGGKFSAIGSKCTHYGAPLVKGVLTVMAELLVLGMELASMPQTEILRMPLRLMPYQASN